MTDSPLRKRPVALLVAGLVLPFAALAVMTAWFVGGDDSETPVTVASGQAAMYEQQLARHRARGDKKALGETYAALGDYYQGEGNLMKAGEMHRRALATFESSGDSEPVVRQLTRLARVYLDRGDNEKAAEIYERAISGLRNLGLERELADAYADLGLAHYATADLARAASAFEAGVAISESLGRVREVAIGTANLGYVSASRNDDEVAVSMLGQAARSLRAEGDFALAAAIHADLSKVYERLGRTADAEQATDDSKAMAATVGAADADYRAGLVTVIAD